MRTALVILLALMGCTPAVVGTDAGPDSGAPGDAGTTADAGPDAGPPPGCHTADGGVPLLGLNDVSMLLPLEADLWPVADLVPRALYDRVVQDPDGPAGLGQTFIFDSYDRFRVVAVRLDLCDRAGPGPCPAVDPYFRLVLQRVSGPPPSADDVALHAFYAVPAAALPGVLAELEALAALQSLDVVAPLQVSPALKAAPAGAYAQRLTTLIRRFCTQATLRRLTFFAQPDIFAQVRWVFRGVELDGGAFADVAIPHATDGGVQHVIFAGNGYDVRMLADVPAGFARVTSAAAIAAATPAEIAQSLSALSEIDDPLSRHVDSLQCVACHVATPLATLRADAGTVPPRFTSSYPLSLDGGNSPASAGSLRAFGWLGTRPMISQRVVNETAQVLAELQQCQ